MNGRRGPCPRPPTTSMTCSAGGSRPSGPRRPIPLIRFVLRPMRTSPRAGIPAAFLVQVYPPSPFGHMHSIGVPSPSSRSTSMLPARTRSWRPRIETSGRRPGKPRRVRSQSRRRSRSQTPQKVIDDGPIWASAANTIMFSAKAPAHHQRLRSRRPSSSGIGAGGTGRRGAHRRRPRQGMASRRSFLLFTALRAASHAEGSAGSRGRSARRGPPAGNARLPRSSPARSLSGSSR